MGDSSLESQVELTEISAFQTILKKKKAIKNSNKKTNTTRSKQNLSPKLKFEEI